MLYKKWYKTIEGLTKNKLAKVENSEEGMLIRLTQGRIH